MSCIALPVAAQVLPPVEALLDVCAHPDHEISDMSFGFWHKLSAQLMAGTSPEQQQQQQQYPPPPGSPLPGGAQPVDQMAVEQQRRREFFAPCFERLVSQVRTRMRYVVAIVLAANVACGINANTKPVSTERAALCLVVACLVNNTSATCRRRTLSTTLHKRLSNCDHGFACVVYRLPDGFNSMRSSERADWRRYRAAWGDVLHVGLLLLASCMALTLVGC